MKVQYLLFVDKKKFIAWNRSRLQIPDEKASTKLVYLVETCRNCHYNFFVVPTTSKIYSAAINFKTKMQAN
jgi:hypothetical protein